MKNRCFQLFIKRIFDFIVSFIALLLCSPVLLLVALLIRLDSKGPVFFVQLRLGKDQLPFSMYKFRTMTHKDRKVHHQVFKGDPEVTKVGSFLRRTKIDELPQLLNVFMGQMSIIGPRPCLPAIKDRFGKYADYRFLVKPGLSSYAAVKGSIYLTWEQKGIYDYIYVKNFSLLLDFYVIILTFRVIIFGEDSLFKKTKTDK